MILDEVNNSNCNCKQGVGLQCELITTSSDNLGLLIDSISA